MKTAIRYLGYPLLVPRTLVGVFIFAVFYRAHSWRWSEGCIECIGGEFLDRFDDTRIWTRIWGRPGAQTWGFAIVYSNRFQMDRKDLRVHERRHVWQSVYMLEVGFLIAYGGHFVWGIVFDGDRKIWVVDRVGYVRHGAVPEHYGELLYIENAKERERRRPRWKRAYLKICWERLAYRYQGEYLDGKHAGAWGSNP